MPHAISESPTVDLRDLVRAILSYDALASRKWVRASLRQGLVWAAVPEPSGLDAVALSVAAGVAELLAERAGQAPPSWAAGVAVTSTPVYLLKAALTVPRLRRMCEEEGPEQLRRRGIWAPPEFLRVV